MRSNVLLYPKTSPSQSMLQSLLGKNTITEISNGQGTEEKKFQWLPFIVHLLGTKYHDKSSTHTLTLMFLRVLQGKPCLHKQGSELLHDWPRPHAQEAAQPGFKCRATWLHSPLSCHFCKLLRRAFIHPSTHSLTDPEQMSTMCKG